MPNLAENHGSIYADLLKGLQPLITNITVMAPAISDGFSGIRYEGDFRVLRVPLKPFIGDMPFYKKGMHIMQMSGRYKKAYKRHLGNESFDVVMSATPPSSFYDVVKLAKQKSGAKFYLILRDIHPECLNRKKIPQYVLDKDDVYNEAKRPYGMNFFVEKLLYFQSQSLYHLVDWVGCMSPLNQTFFKSIAPYVDDKKITLLPNWYKGREYSGENNDDLREKYNLRGKFIAIFGGTIGEAQAVWNIATLAKHNLDKKDVVFLVVGSGVQKKVPDALAREDNLTNIRFMEYMPREDYERILELADVGLISIDEKYTVPTCPSKVIGYMALAKPVIAMFNEGSDYGDFYLGKAQCGLWSTNMNNEKMFDNFDTLYKDKELRCQMGLNGYRYYRENFSVEKICQKLYSQLTNG